MWKYLLGCSAITKNIQNLLLLQSSWGLWLIPGHAADIFWVEKCAPINSSKDVYPAIIFLTFECTVSKNGHTHHNSLVVFTARMFSCVRVTILEHQDLLFIDLHEIQKQMRPWVYFEQRLSAPFELFCLFLDVYIFLLQWCLLQQLHLTLLENSLKNFCHRVNFF